MKIAATFLLTALLCASALAQVPAVVTARNVKISKVNPAVTTSPEFTVKNTTDKRAEYLKWLEIEVEFELVGVEMADELTFKYSALINGKLAVGEVTHLNIPKGKNRYSVMYISPRGLDRMTDNKPLTGGMIDNIKVEVSKQGQVLGTEFFQKKATNWNLAQIPNLLVPKSDTPFQVLWWDRYEAVKPSR